MLWCSNFSEVKHKTWLHIDKDICNLNICNVDWKLEVVLLFKHFWKTIIKNLMIQILIFQKDSIWHLHQVYEFTTLDYM